LGTNTSYGRTPVAARIVEEAVLAGAALVEGVMAAAVVGAGEVAGAPVVPRAVDADVADADVVAAATRVDACPELHDDAIKTVTMSAAVVRM
jgi:hypothetical protein